MTQQTPRLPKFRPRQGFDNDQFLAYTDNRDGNPDLYGRHYLPPIASL